MTIVSREFSKSFGVLPRTVHFIILAWSSRAASHFSLRLIDTLTNKFVRVYVGHIDEVDRLGYASSACSEC